MFPTHITAKRTEYALELQCRNSIVSKARLCAAKPKYYMHMAYINKSDQFSELVRFEPLQGAKYKYFSYETIEQIIYYKQRSCLIIQIKHFGKDC